MSQPIVRAPRLRLLYHFFHPDDVVSAQLFSELGVALAARGWDVEAWPSNRGCRDETIGLPARDRLGAVRIRRVWRPRWPQARALGRIGNALWMAAAWAFAATRRKSRPDVLLVGTDPILGVASACLWRRLQPGVRVAHWCFDLYPEAAIADGVLTAHRWPARCMRAMAARAYRACALLVDIGPCMRERLAAYDATAVRETIAPWALDEPGELAPQESLASQESLERQALFGNARFGLLYSGSYGRAHASELFLELARALAGDDIAMAFSVRGPSVSALVGAIRPSDANVRLVPFAASGGLRARLAAADVHLASLAEPWTGTVVPSKFFGSLAAGRPVLFQGSPASSIARWIREHDVGWILAPGNVESVAAALRALAADPAAQTALRARCRALYDAQFSRAAAVERFDRALRALLPPGSGW